VFQSRFAAIAPPREIAEIELSISAVIRQFASLSRCSKVHD